jgi:hypothetical protein
MENYCCPAPFMPEVRMLRARAAPTGDFETPKNYRSSFRWARSGDRARRWVSDQNSRPAIGRSELMGDVEDFGCAFSDDHARRHGVAGGDPRQDGAVSDP